MRPRLAPLALLGALVPAVGYAELPPQPEIASGFASPSVATGRRLMAVTAHPLATDAALEMLRVGGSAMDAAIAAQMVLGLVEPQSSGIGGGGLLLGYDARRRRIDAWDGRETAPLTAVAPPTDERGERLGFRDAVHDPRSVGVPGLVPMLAQAHARAGRLPWKQLFGPAIRLAEAGFPVSPRLHRLLQHEGRFADPAAQAYFFDADGAPWPVGHRLRNPALAASLQQIAEAGPAALRHGALADAIVEAVRGGLPIDVAEARGLLGHRDLLAYTPVRREALCGAFRQYRVCGFPPPSSGATTVLAMLGIWSRLPAPSPGAGTTAFAQRFAEVGRLAYADRAACIGDPAFHAVPVAALLDGDYLTRRAAQVGATPAAQPSSPGIPCPASGEAGERPSTTHLSIVDGEGNAVALTSSVEDAFGNRRMAGGFLLNNQLTDFSSDGVNRIAPGKRPRSAMSPTLVFDGRGRLVALLGSPGGSQIPNYVAQALIGLLEARLSPEAVAAQARVGSRNGPLEVERGRTSPEVITGLHQLGEVVRESDMTSGLALVVRRGKGWTGVADPRREGRAAGD